MKTTININNVLAERVRQHLEETKETQTDFFTRAILNQLEADGDFEIRDEIGGYKNDFKS